MARISKRLHTVENLKDNSVYIGRGKIYKAGIYARLSSDQDAKKNESIDIQIDIAKRYAEEWNVNHKERIEIVENYVDLGKTGTNFERDAFKRLMQDVRMGEINCVIVKDLSRFGRNYLEAGNYIEKIFPFFGVRFIAVSDGYDTGADGNHTKQTASEIKNLINDMYAKDSSKKAKLSLKQRREEGSYAGGPPPYGYLSSWEGKKRKLLPDENISEIIRYIYEQFVVLENYTAVTDQLNSRRLNPPAVYKKTGEVYCPKDSVYKGWDKGSVERILKSEIYLGNLVQGKTSITAGNEKTRIHKGRDEWVVAKQSHEPLIDRELFEKAAEVCHKIQQRTEKQNSPSAGYPILENIFDKVLYCGVCGRKMTRTSYVKYYADGETERRDGYLCGNSTSTKIEHCPESNRISKTELLDILFVVIGEEILLNIGKRKSYEEQGRAQIRKTKQELEQKRRQAEHAMVYLQEEEGRKYMEYRKGHIRQKDYVSYKMYSEEQRQQLEQQIGELDEAIKNLEREGEHYLKTIRSLLRWKRKKEITKELVETLIEKIYIYPGKRVEVVFLYSSAIKKAVNA